MNDLNHPLYSAAIAVTNTTRSTAEIVIDTAFFVLVLIKSNYVW